MENEEGVENEPSGKNLVTVDVQTEVSFFDLMLGGRIEPSKGVVQYPTPLPLASVEHSPLSSPPISLSPPPVSIPSSPLPVQAPSLPSPVGGSQSPGLNVRVSPPPTFSDQPVLANKPGDFKEIIDERFNNGTREFLVTRMEDKSTGEPFPPRWIPDAECGLQLLRDYRKNHPLTNVRETRYNLRRSK